MKVAEKTSMCRFTIYARPADRIDVHVADIIHNPASSRAVALTLALRRRPSPMALS
jgi:hypothetical protein